MFEKVDAPSMVTVAYIIHYFLVLFAGPSQHKRSTVTSRQDITATKETWKGTQTAIMDVDSVYGMVSVHPED